MKKNKVADAAGLGLTAVSIIFLIRRITALHVDFTRILTPVNAAMIVIMPFLSVTAILLNACCWKMNLQLFSKEYIPAGDAFHAYAKANIMKYLPGNVGHYAGRQLFGAGLGIKQTELAAASCLEIGYSIVSMILCALLLSARTLMEELHNRVSDRAAVWICAGFCMILACSSVLVYFFRRNKYVAVFVSLIQKPVFWKTFFLSVVLYTFGSMLIIMEYVVLLGQYVPLDFQLMFLLLARNYMAVFIGYITPGVPGGIGVREAVLMKSLSTFFSGDIVILAAVVHRMIMILGDLVTVPVSSIFAVKIHNNRI